MGVAGEAEETTAAETPADAKEAANKIQEINIGANTIVALFIILL